MSSFLSGAIYVTSLDTASVMTDAPPRRLDSLDVFRGLTIAAMILVSTPGTWSAVYTPLDHAGRIPCLDRMVFTQRIQGSVIAAVHEAGDGPLMSEDGMNQLTSLGRDLPDTNALVHAAGRQNTRKACSCC